jgi:hypothetical protein
MALKHAEPGEIVDLCPLGDRLTTAKTNAIVRTSSFEAVRLVVPVGTEISSHKVPGKIMLLCIEGMPNSDCSAARSTCGQAIGSISKGASRIR